MAEKDCDDEELIEDACGGSERAFRRLVDCNQDRLLRSMAKMLGCREDAEEAVQEAFIRAFSRLDRFNRECKFSTWIYRIAFNRAITGQRKKRPRISLDQRLEDFGEQVHDPDFKGVDERLLREEQIELVHRALDELSDDHRAILVLREMDELAYEEIAGVLSISTGTVRSRLNRARGRLREAVEAVQASVATGDIQNG